MSQVKTEVIVLSILAVAAIGAFIWKRKRLVYQKSGSISKIFFYPVKSIKGIEVTKAKCTKLGLEVNGFLDRSFMLINEDKVLLSQRQAPTLALLVPQIIGNQLIISGPSVDSLTIDIELAPNPKAEIIECRLHEDVVSTQDCGEKAAKWFQEYLKLPNIRLVRFFPELPDRKCVKNHPFYKKMRNKYPISLQDLSAFHVLSQSSIDDLISRIGEQKVSVFNFRPNILFDGCAPYAEDSWHFMKINDVEMVNVLPVTRCLLTTVEPDTGILTQKEPLTTLRKYRIPKDPEVLKKTGPLPCLGTACYILKTGSIRVHDEVFATITHPLQTVQK